MATTSSDWTASPPPPPPPLKIQPLATLALLLAFLPVLLIANQTRQLLNSKAAGPVTYPCPDSYSCPTPTSPACPNSYSCPTPSPRPTSISTPTPTPKIPSSTTTIDIYAAGTPSLGVYPTMVLGVDGITFTWKNVRGNPHANKFLKFSYTLPRSIPVNSNLRIGYTNDRSLPGAGDRNLRVDKIVVNNKVYQTEGVRVYGRGAKNSRNRCANGYLRTEWLYCNGYFNYTLY